MSEINKEKLKEKLWNEVMRIGSKWEKGITHQMTPLQVEILTRALETAGVSPYFAVQFGYYDMNLAKYKLYDEIGMLLTGRYKGYPEETPKQVKNAEDWSINLALDYIGCAQIAENTKELYRCIVERNANRAWGSKISKKYAFSTEEILKKFL